MGGDFLVAIEVIDSGKMVGACSFIGTLLVMAGVERNPGPANKTFVFRYQYLLIEGGSVMLRQIFDHIVGPDFKVYLDNNPSQKAKFQHIVSRNILTPSQLQLLPPIDNSPSSDNFDITLLCCLLRNVCGLCSSSDPVWSNPRPSDTRVEAHIARLKTARNNLAHCGSVFDDVTDLITKWSDLRLILQGLSNHCGYTGLNALIHTAETIEIDESLKASFDKSLKEWRHEIGEVRSEVDDVRSEVDDVRAEVDDVSAKVDDVTAAIDELRTVVDKLSTKVDNCVTGAEQQSNAMNDMNSSIVRLLTRVVRLEAIKQNSFIGYLLGPIYMEELLTRPISILTGINGERKNNPWLGSCSLSFISLLAQGAADTLKQYIADLFHNKTMNELRIELCSVSYFLYRFHLTSRLCMLSMLTQCNIPHRQPLKNKNLFPAVT